MRQPLERRRPGSQCARRPPHFFGASLSLFCLSTGRVLLCVESKPVRSSQEAICRMAASIQRPISGRNNPCETSTSNSAVEATTLTEPYVSLAEKKGCRLICSSFYHGTEVASDRVDAETYRAFNRAVREAVRRINADKRAYLRYFIDYHKAKDPDIAVLQPEDLRESRIIVVEPAPIPPEELQRTYEWVRSWGMLDETKSALDLVNVNVQSEAHALALPKTP